MKELSKEEVKRFEEDFTDFLVYMILMHGLNDIQQWPKSELHKWASKYKLERKDDE